MSDIEREAFERIERQFTSGNSVSVDRASVRKEEWEAAKKYAARQAPASGEVEPVAWIRFRSYRIAADDVIEGVEVCEPHEIGDDGSPATPVYLHPPAKVPEGFTLKKVEGNVTTITITRNSDGAWCGGGIKGDDGANGVRYEFLNALLTTPTPATTPETESCEWHSDENGCWMSACGKEWWFDEGGPEDNGMHFCIKCGKPCVELGNSEDGGEIYDSAL